MPSLATASPMLLSVPVSLTRLSNFDAFVVFLKNGPMNRRPASLRWLQPGAVRQFHQYYQDAMTPCCHPAALRFLRLAVPRLHSLRSLLGGRVRRRGLELVTRFSCRDVAEEATGSPKFLENLNCPFAHVPRRRQDCLHQTITVQQRGPWYVNSKGSREGSFDAQ